MNRGNVKHRPGGHRKKQQGLAIMRRKKLQRLVIFKRDDYVCVYCGIIMLQNTEAPEDSSATIDHIEPKKLKDSTDLQCNLTTSCRKCNQAKGDMLWYEYAKQEGLDMPQLSLRISLRKSKKIVGWWSVKTLQKYIDSDE